MTQHTDEAIDTTPRLKLRSFLGYAAGDAGNNLAFSLASGFLLLYYTDVVGISPAYAAPIFLIVRIWDAFFDVFVGRMVDHTKSRWGKFRPWILFASLPLLLSSVWAFSLPATDSQAMKLFWAYLSYTLLNLLYSMVNIPYGSLASAMTQRPTERAKLATFRSLGSATVGLLLSFAVAPMVQRWSASSLYKGKLAELGSNPTETQLAAAAASAQAEAAAGLQSSLTTITLIFVVLGMALYLFTFFTAKEQVIRPLEDNVSFKESLGAVLRNKPLMWLCVSSLIFLTATITLSTMGIYYARDVLENAGLMAVLSAVMTAAIFAVAPFISRLVARYGKRFLYLAGTAAFVFGGALAFVATPATAWIGIVAYFFLGIGTGLVNTLMWAMEADTIEYSEWKTGHRTEGTTYAVFSFVRKLGQAFGGFIGAAILGLTGYVGTQAVQTEQAIDGIRIATALVPAGLAVLTFLIMLKYPLTDRAYRAIALENEERKAAARAQAAAGGQPQDAQHLPTAPAAGSTD
ncbi:MAG: glycoside-pentoside-hexuronide (GPH):cation symporter [Arthrobacter sp.]|jgi:glucuronide carrier protein|nr:glycoside-pentoside-hexuronide (GPH):cation symporter [Arthrobacter sp.]